MNLVNKNSKKACTFVSSKIWLFLFCCSAISFQSCRVEQPALSCTVGFEDTRDGEIYCTTTIGTQKWMTENMRFQQEGAFENPNSETLKYGLLYTYEAAQKACPVGWHLPTDAEWKLLERTLGMSTEEVDKVNQRGTNQGQQLKDKEAWKGEINTDEHNFGALPLGEYNPSYGPYFNLGEQASFWTATRSDTSGGVWVRVLKRQEQGITRTYYSKLSGHACRCLAD